MPLSLTQLKSLTEYVGDENPAAARRLHDRIEAAVMMLAEFPKMGRPGAVSNTRELVVSGTPYIVPYEISGGTVRVLTVIHGKQMYPPAPIQDKR